MSFALDVNLLLYASDATSPWNRRAVDFLEACADKNEVFCVAWPTVMGYLRMATHPAVFDRPLTHEDALRNVERLLSLPHVRVLSEGEGFLEIYRDTVRNVPTRGNLVPDAHLAALLRQHGVRMLYTRDRDFMKFDFLEVRDPFKERD